MDSAGPQGAIDVKDVLVEIAVSDLPKSRVLLAALWERTRSGTLPLKRRLQGRRSLGADRERQGVALELDPPTRSWRPVS